MDVRSLVKSLHPLEVKVLLRYGDPDAIASGTDRLDSSRLQAELEYKEGHSNQAFSWLSAKGLAAEDGRDARTVYELTPLGREFAEKGTPDERILRFLAEKGPAKLPEIVQALGLEQKDVGSAFGGLSKDGVLVMDAEKRAAPAEGARERLAPRQQAIQSLLKKAEQAPLDEQGLAAAEIPQAPGTGAVSWIASWKARREFASQSTGCSPGQGGRVNCSVARNARAMKKVNRDPGQVFTIPAGDNTRCGAQ